MSEFGHEVVNRCYTTAAGVTFQVLEIKPYPKDKVSERYTVILSFEPGFLVAVSYRGILLPNITLDGGVVQLTKVKVGDQVFTRPKAISAALGIERPLYPYVLQ